MLNGKKKKQKWITMQADKTERLARRMRTHVHNVKYVVFAARESYVM